MAENHRWPQSTDSAGAARQRRTTPAADSVADLLIDPAPLPVQLRVGDEPVRERFDPPTGPAHALADDGLWTTTLRRHGPTWYLHMLNSPDMDQLSWWQVTPRTDARIARLDSVRDIAALVPDAYHETLRVPWQTLAESVDAVWLTEQGFNAVETSCSRPAQTFKRLYGAFTLWVPDSVLWLDWCFRSVDRYRYGCCQALSSPEHRLPPR